MKKLALVLMSAFALSAMATDSYLYWMVAGKGDYAGEWTAVRISPSGATDGYLSLYYGGAGSYLGETASYDYATSASGIYANLGSTLGSTYLVELLLDSTSVATATLNGSDIGAYLTSSLLSPVPSPMEVSGFTATGAVPEPTSGLLMLFGLAGLALRRKRRKVVSVKRLSFAAFLVLAASATAEETILGPTDLDVDADSENMQSVYLKGGKPMLLNGDVVFDGFLSPSAYDEGESPDISAVKDPKFAMYFGRDGAATNIYVIAAGSDPVSAKTFSTTNYCLNVTNEAFLGSGECRVTIYALRGVTTYEDSAAAMMMGFVVFVDETPVQCGDDDYFDKLPKEFSNPLNNTARALVANRYLFPSPLRDGYGVGSSMLTAIDFAGSGRVRGLAAGYAPMETSAPFADMSGLTVLPAPTRVAIGDMLADASQTNGLTKAGNLFAPAEANLSDAQQEAYRSLFGELVFEQADGGGYMVMAYPTDEAMAMISNNVNACILKIDLDAVRAGTIVLDEVVPGLFYRVRRSSAAADGYAPGEWSVAQGDETVEVAIPDGEPGDTSGFFRLEASPADE